MSTRISTRPPPAVISAYRRGFHLILRAYGFGALSYLTPRLLSLLLAKVRRGKKTKSTSIEVTQILKQTLEIHRFPAFCGFTIALRYILLPLFENLLSVNKYPKNLVGGWSLLSRQAVASFFASTLAAAGGLRLLNAKRNGDAGRTLDLTLFSLVRAADVIVGELWRRRRDCRVRSRSFTRLELSIEYLVDSAIFSLATAVIMFTWFYSPDKLPAVYNKQITKIANADERLVVTLRQIRSGEFVYGVDTGQASLLQSYCEDLGLPKIWGDPVQTVPIPCEVVHGGQTKSCEVYALHRFWAATWKTAFPIYLGLNMIKFLRLRKPKIQALIWALIGSARSAAFLGSFVGLFWYAICLTRTRLGPRFLSLDCLALENLCVKVGCLLCGWSILIETPRRRTEIMFFVAPRALAALLPRRYNRKYEWIEATSFAVSTGIVMTTLKHKPQSVRGVFGKLMGKIISE